MIIDQNPIESSIGIQSNFLHSKPLESRKLLGQYFTGSIVSNYMASLINKPESDKIRLLDAGAGTGILTASSVKRLFDLGYKNIKSVVYEIDVDVLPSLENTLKALKTFFNKKGNSFSYEIHNEDFVLSRPDKNIKPFDVSVINPPYFKYNVKESPYAQAASDLYKGDPNIYASFMAVVVACLRDGGQMIAITPRSFTNGLYFEGFRKYLLNNTKLDLVHIFKDRDKVFKKDYDVLQENIICRFVKNRTGDKVIVRSSDCDASISQAEEQIYPKELIIDASNGHRLIRIPESKYQAKILEQAETLQSTFEEAGYFISTGPVVEHRTRNYITDDSAIDNAVPLYRPHNVKSLTAKWDGVQKKDEVFRLENNFEKHLVLNKTFVLIKRFSSKDEKRRLVSGVYLPDRHKCEYIGFANKINYMGLAVGELGVEESYGLAAIFNSSFMDKYFRCISGNTQVNATEIRVMKFPSREQVGKIGKQIDKTKSYTTEEIDSIVNPVLGVNI